MAPIGYVRAVSLTMIGDTIRSLGGNPDAVFLVARVTRGDVDDEDGFIPLAVRGQLLAGAVRETRCEHFGLLLGRSARVGMFGRLGELMLACRNVGQALDTMRDCWALHSSSAIILLRQEGESTSLGFLALEGNLPGAATLQDAAMSTALSVMREMLGSKWRPSAVRLMRREPADPALYENFFEAPCSFNAVCAELMFPSDVLAASLEGEGADPTRDDEGIRASLKAELNGPYWDHHAYWQTRSLLVQHRLTEHDLAQALGISSRTLIRRLGARGTSFQGLAERARFSQSRALIRETDMTFAEMATALGYQEASSFTRAFRRWSGMSPSQWRKAKVKAG